MPNKNKSLQKHLNDALVEISDSNQAHSLELLRENGINTTNLLKNSLKKINSYRINLSKSIQEDKKRIRITELKNKINEYLMMYPEKTAQIFNNFVSRKPSSIQFQSFTKLDRSMFEKIEDTSVLEGLVKELNSELESK